jgi:hypothetical protein
VTIRPGLAFPTPTGATCVKAQGASRVIFVDEIWTKTNMSRPRGWAPRQSSSSIGSPRPPLQNRHYPRSAAQPYLIDGRINGERFPA